MRPAKTGWGELASHMCPVSCEQVQCAYRLKVIHAISLREILEPCARYNVIYFYLAGMERFSFACANVRPVECTDCSFEKNDFFSQVAFSLPVFIAVPDVVIGG